MGLDSRLRGNDKGVGFIRTDNGIFVAMTGKSGLAVCITNVPDKCKSLLLGGVLSKMDFVQMVMGCTVPLLKRGGQFYDARRTVA